MLPGDAHPGSRSLSPRASSNGSNTVIIVAVVAGIVGGVVALALLYTLLRRLLRPRAAPLPPIQQLAHQRQRDIAQFHDTIEQRKTKTATWFDDGLVPMPALSATASSSTSLMLPGRGRESSAPSTTSTFFREDPGKETPTYEDMEPLSADDQLLPVPHRPFVDHRSSGGSAGSFGTDSPSSSSFEDVGEPPRHSSDRVPSSSSHHDVQRSPSEGDHIYLAPRLRPRRSQQQPRPDSMASSFGAHSALGMGRPGIPHHPASRMQIVLPAPLAPELYPQGLDSDDNLANRPFTMVGDDDDHMHFYRKRTTSDAWATPASSRSNSRGPPAESRPAQPGPRRRMASDSASSTLGLRHSRYGSSGTLPSIPALPSKRSPSASPLARSPAGIAAEECDPMGQEGPLMEEDETIRGRGVSGRQPTLRSPSDPRPRSQSRGRAKNTLRREAQNASDSRSQTALHDTATAHRI